MKAVIIFLFLSASAPLPPKYCTPDTGNMTTYCGGTKPGGHPCLFWHPDKEFCDDETAPLPSCCRAADEKGFNGCACCNYKGSSKKINSNAKTYQHLNPVVEYDISK